ncbi:MAG: exodeoxyribonuclease VII large subunit [Fermentimonas sp.]|nr:exodeoxyribonuclease VII large subunit [Fermentimonas sp.]
MPENSLSLTELNLRVRDAIRDYLPDTYWVRAETSDVRRNRNGHCYLEFLEKDSVDQSIVAKARGVIWSNTYEMLSAYFLSETGQQFTSGLNVLVCVSVTFHELYGYSLTVVDIDPTFTLGEIARNRQLVINRLEEEGVLTLNKELKLPELTNRIAVISSPTAAGYEDFRDQLYNNHTGFVFYTKLFPAVMQGDLSESSIIAALEKIFLNKDLFDAVAIIRGGGASADLNCFDSYLLANNVAQFPLPVVSGIGHERDVTVLDVVSHTRAKTPTAVAEFFITHLTKTASELIALQDRTITTSEKIILRERTDLLSLSKEVIHRSALRIQKENGDVEKLTTAMNNNIRQQMQGQFHLLERNEQYINMISPLNILKRGYTLVLKNGKIVTSTDEIEEGDTIQTRFRDGNITSEVINKEASGDSVL